jgi:hypothetical protein
VAGDDENVFDTDPCGVPPATAEHGRSRLRMRARRAPGELFSDPCHCVGPALTSSGVTGSSGAPRAMTAADGHRDSSSRTTTRSRREPHVSEEGPGARW